MNGKAVSSVRRVTADPRQPAQTLSTAAAALARHQEIVGTRANLNARLDSAVASVSTRDAEAASVTTATRNPCLACSIQQDCCTRLSGLRLTREEFQRCFSRHVERLEIKHEGPVYVITPKNGGTCPNWQDGGCAVYDERPRECRLFPFTLFVRQQTSHTVSLGYHCDTRCPMKTELLLAADEADAMVSDFGREAFPVMSVEALRESLIESLKRRGLRRASSIVAQIKEWSRSTDHAYHATARVPVGTNSEKASESGFDWRRSGCASVVENPGLAK